MSDKHKRGEFVVTAPTDGGVARGLGLVLAHLEKGQMSGEAALEKHQIKVQWRTVDTQPAQTGLEGSILEPKGGAIAPNLPDITKMDIEEARGVVGTAAGTAELDILEDIEKSSAKFPGGRKGVLVYIEECRKEAEVREAEKAAKEAPEEPREVTGGFETVEAGSFEVAQVPKEAPPEPPEPPEPSPAPRKPAKGSRK